MYDFNLYMQSLLSAMLCYEKLKIAEADAALKARSKSKKEQHMNVAVLMGRRQRVCALELMSYFDHRIQFVTDKSEELEAVSRQRFEKGPCSVDWSFAADVYRIQAIVILDAPDYSKDSKPLAEFRIDRRVIDETCVDYYYGLTNVKAFAHFFNGFDFLKHARFPEGINTPELISAYLTGVDHRSSFETGDGRDPIHDLMSYTVS